VIDIRREYGAPGSDLISYKLRRNKFGKMSAKRLSFLLLIVLLNLVAKLIFADSNVLHFGGNNASTSVGELGYSLARSRYEGVIFDVFEAEVVEAFVGTALTATLLSRP